VVATAVYLYYLGATGEVNLARTALTTAMVLCGLVLIPFVEPPTQGWVAGDELSGDWRPSALALGLLAGYCGVMAIPAVRNAFELASLPLIDYALIILVVISWAVLLRFIWRERLLERLLEVD
jgi:cation-transporting ATPase E